MRRSFIAAVLLGGLVGLGVPRDAAAAACTGKPEVRLLHWAWNAQMGLMHATGAAQVLPESLMCRAGVNLKLMRQDDVGKMQENLIVFATDLKAGTLKHIAGTGKMGYSGDGGSAKTATFNGPKGIALGPDKCLYVVDTENHRVQRINF